MPGRGCTFYKGQYYHVYNRGVNREEIFYSIENYQYCLFTLFQYSVSYVIPIIAYALMPNHYHLLLRQDGDVPISSLMGVVFNRYVQALNRQRERKGVLFESRFKHALVDEQAYILHLCRYIHLNPVEAGLVNRPEDWEFSDYSKWLRYGGSQAAPDFLPEGFDYRAFVEEYREEKRMHRLIGKYLID